MSALKSTPGADELLPLLRDNEECAFDDLVAVFPRSDFGRTPLSQLLMGAVGSVIAAVCLFVSFAVVVSKVPSEQLPFQQAMWGFAAVGGILGAYGAGSGVWRLFNGIARVGRWWLLFHRGVVILNNGHVEQAWPLDALKVRSPSKSGETMKLLNPEDRTLPLPLRAEDALVKAVQEQQRELVRAGQDAGTQRQPLRYVLGWSAAQLFGEDRVYRVYSSPAGMLMVYAGPFVPSKLGVSSNASAAQGALAHVGNAFAEWTGGSAFESRRQYLDAMSPEELKIEASVNAVSAILTPETTTDIRIDPPSNGIWSNPSVERTLAGRLSFRHQNRHWQLAFFRRDELDFVTKSLRQTFGPERIEITQPKPQVDDKAAKTLAYSVNGCGTVVLDAGAQLRWHRDETNDGVLTFCLFAMPLFPLKVLHTFGEHGSIRGRTFHWIPLRWSLRLVAYAFVNQYLNIIGLTATIGTLFSVVALITRFTGPRQGPMPTFWFWFCVLGVTVGWPIFFGGWWGLLRLDRRNCQIRRVIGLHEFGGSDPATWTQETLDMIGTAESRYQSASWAEAAQKLLRAGDYSQALYAARLCIATEDRNEGQRLTNEILQQEPVQQFVRG